MDEVVTDVNRYLVGDLGDVERFMTLFLLEVRDEAVSWVSAGHEPALLVSPDSDAVADLDGDGPLLGIDADLTFSEGTTSFREPGQVLALCTDGITEGWSEDAQQFGRERLRQSLLRHAAQPAASIVERVLKDVDDFRGRAPQKDDLTLIVLKRIR